MVELIGVHHAGFNTFLGEVRFNDFAVYPSGAFLKHLSKFPKGTKVGFESFSEQGWKEVREDLRSQVSENYDLLISDDGRDYFPRFPDVFDKYWSVLKNFCCNTGLEVIFLEDKETFMKYNKAVMEQAKLEARIDKTLFREDNESNISYSKKLFKCNEERHNLEIQVRKIHEFERDDKLLGAIRSSMVDVAIVGQGHSDFWFGDSEFIKESYGIDITKHSTDLMNVIPDSGRYEMIFTENADVDPDLLFEREGLERAIRLFEKGKITEHGEPAYVGVWNIPEPSNGYFEVFVEKSNGKTLSGHIHDLLGVAIFEGTMNHNKIEFIKEYTQLSSKKAAKRSVNYKAIRKDNEFYGFFYANDFTYPFYMEKSPREKPIDLSLKFEKFNEENPGFCKQL